MNTQMNTRWSSIVLLLFVVAGTARGEDQSRLAGLVSRLSSESWKERKEAMEKLVAVGEEALPLLHQLADHNDDGEVRARAASAIGQIEENRQTGMTLVTLRMEDVPAQQAVAELARQARAALPTEPANLL